MSFKFVFHGSWFRGGWFHGGWFLAALVSCSAGVWQAEPSSGYDDQFEGRFVPPEEPAPFVAEHYRRKTIGETRPVSPAEQPEVVATRIALARTRGRVLGTFRNTYYDFPSEDDFSGPFTTLFDAGCQAIGSVKTAFHDQLCVQGSGLLSSGSPVSFAKRDCSCARTCPKTKQKICFESLSRSRFPWGRGATGDAITPLLTVAVDSDVVPLHSAVYIPEYEGLPSNVNSGSVHDGCFIAQDRGSRVKGKHVDVFTGESAMTRLWNRLMPSNKGVTVVLDAPQCARAKSR